MVLEAVLSLKSPVRGGKTINAEIIFEKRIRVSVFFYQFPNRDPKEKFVRVKPQKKIQVKWKDDFTLIKIKTHEKMGKGKVLIPEAVEQIPEDLNEHQAFLEQLNKDEGSMLLALAQSKGFQGLSQKEISDFSGFSKKRIMTLSQTLEQEKRVRIVSFNPVIIIPRSSLGLLENKVLRLIKDQSQGESVKKGLTIEEIRNSIKAHPKLIEITINYLKYLNRINELDDRFILSSPGENISKADERILRRMEEMCRNGEFKKYSLPKLQEMFGVSSERFERLFDILLQRKKVVHGKEGFIFFSEWLDQLISKLQKSRSKEITVAEFKKMSGLSRKYAIPLLELLNKKGVIRKEGSLHKIL